MDVRLQLDELCDEKDNEIRDLKFRLSHEPRPTTRRPSQSQNCPCNAWKIACCILTIMVVLLVLVLVGVLTFQIVGPSIRPT